MLDVSLIKNRISCVEFAQRNNLDINKSGDRCVSPLRINARNKTSFIVTDDFFFDFGSGQGGDVIDFAALLLFKGDKGEAIRHLAKLTGVTDESNNFNTSEWINYTQNLCNEVQYYHEHLTEADRNYLHNRRISDETINRNKIGRTNNGRLCIPYWKNNYVNYYATRYLPGGAFPDRKYMKMPIDDYNEHTAWGFHTLDRNDSRDLLIIAEGAFDALSFEQEGYSVISAITGHFSKDQLPAVLSVCKSFKKVFIVYDNDAQSKAGEGFTIKMAKILIENRINCLVGKVPATYKDVSEYYADNGDLSVLITEATDAVTFIASKITDLTEFETFAHKVCRYMSKVQVDLFFKPLYSTSSFDTDCLKTLQKDCKSAPLDKTIMEDVLNKHQLLYNPKISFYEYNGKCWQQKSDTEIERYISDELGPYTTGSRLYSCLKVIKSHTVTDNLMNSPNVVNFINGTLELTNVEPYYNFREHRSTDYCTYCLDYPFVAGAHSKEWQDFIHSVTDENGKREAFLQEFAGYVLYPDNSMQKCAGLVGEGANGKSIYFNTLSRVFGVENVTNITMSNLSQDFQVIHLKNSMLNISSENKSDAFGAEEIFKQIVGGDDIFACYKGKDYIRFKPRAKMIISFNNLPKFNDKSDGLTRRFAFVKFPLRFVEEPTKENERLIDRTLESKFAENSQLSKIFNWVLDGYIMIRRCGYLTETDDHTEVMEEFREESDPVITFVKQLTIEERTPNFAMYSNYKFWCDNNGYKAEPSVTVLRRISKHIKELRPDIKPYRSGNNRGYEPA